MNGWMGPQIKDKTVICEANNIILILTVWRGDGIGVDIKGILCCS